MLFPLSAPQPRALRAWAIPRQHAAAVRACAVLRVFQITGVIPALLAQRRFGVPYVTSYGFWYGQLSRPGPKRVLKAFVERLGLRRAAAVCGIPVVASNRGGIPSIVTDGETGLLFDPTSSKQLADCLRRVLQDPGLARRLGQAGRALVVERYDLGPLVEREITLLHDVARTGS